MEFEVPTELRKKYLERRRQECENCRQALQTSDFAYLEKVGHQIKGNAASFGFDTLGGIAESLEEAALSHRYEDAQKALLELYKFLETAL
jgi:HPt (histidine-containing phosphotransfer) domain-containing protein